MQMHSKNQAGKKQCDSNLQSVPVCIETITVRKIYRLQRDQIPNNETYVMRFDRHGMPFRAGQHITLGIPGNNQVREYSIYSTEQDTALEVLIKEVETGSCFQAVEKLIRVNSSRWMVRLVILPSMRKKPQ